MGKSIVETLMGACVIAVALLFIFTAYRSGNIAPKGDTYMVVGKFKEVGTLNVGSDIRIGGIKVGTVIGQKLDPASYMAIVEMAIDNKVGLPKDSTAAIVSDGLLGGKYIAIEPGGDNTMLRKGDALKYTQDAVNLESLIGKFAFGGVSNGQGKDDAPEPAQNQQKLQSGATPKNPAIPSLD